MLTTRLPSHLAQALRSVIASFPAPESTIKNLSTAYSPMQNRHSNLPGNKTMEKDRDEEERNGREGEKEEERMEKVTIERTFCITQNKKMRCDIGL